MIFKKKNPLVNREFTEAFSKFPETITRVNYENGETEVILLQDHLEGALTSADTGLRKPLGITTDKDVITDYTSKLAKAIEDELNNENLTKTKEMEASKLKDQEQILKLKKLLFDKEKQLEEDK